MKIIILGAGVAGVASAYYLNRAGHDVTVIDRQAGVADETSYANAGQLSFGYTTPWAAPSIPLKALKWLGKAHSPLLIKPDGSLFQLKWLAQMTANCTAAAYARNQSRMMRISEYSCALFAELDATEKLDYEQRSGGTLHLFRDKNLFDLHQKSMGVLDSFNVPYQTLDADGVLQFEPALAHIKHEIAGGFELPNDRTGDCRIFTQKLAKLCQERGVQFQFNCAIHDFQLSGSRVNAVRTSAGDLTADVFLCALGSFSRPILQKLGLDLPIYPIKGYSLTIPIHNADNAPQSTVLDERYKVALTRFNQRIRVGGMAELSGYELQRPPVHRETLSMVAQQLFPHAGDIAQAEYWSGLRPVTPDSTPIVGRTRLDNLFTNTGHGTLGWTMSLGSAKIVADLIDHDRADVKFDDLNMMRYAC
ncbi:D-amino acid dehydrogenase [Alysiella filiformis]|uniref:D-amino-acid dehydrogenase n=1 Tax=Alysiella filiformis DSM 16848 TaxID=1120981 RepID=A0A286EMR3_9NEIS|nr:D-amino acid dehydrogenase [Alysiella filiformis]QMT31984.1 D-amino acid dehydrogenase [Alysiella filiformis]UBQ57108.1 D-amino acid dehydrogenase [Alysiella filiformis DSM 16848]SOD72240.1 D-amino-acid dehydrogenase [Alysiella filiformis DSM 16848]